MKSENIRFRIGVYLIGAQWCTILWGIEGANSLTIGAPMKHFVGSFLKWSFSTIKRFILYPSVDLSIFSCCCTQSYSCSVVFLFNFSVNRRDSQLDSHRAFLFVLMRYGANDSSGFHVDRHWPSSSFRKRACIFPLVMRLCGIRMSVYRTSVIVVNRDRQISKRVEVSLLSVRLGATNRTLIVTC